MDEFSTSHSDSRDLPRPATSNSAGAKTSNVNQHRASRTAKAKDASTTETQPANMVRRPYPIVIFTGDTEDYERIDEAQEEEERRIREERKKMEKELGPSVSKQPKQSKRAGKPNNNEPYSTVTFDGQDDDYETVDASALAEERRKTNEQKRRQNERKRAAPKQPKKSRAKKASYATETFTGENVNEDYERIDVEEEKRKKKQQKEMQSELEEVGEEKPRTKRGSYNKFRNDTPWRECKHCHRKFPYVNEDEKRAFR